jgi:hypothetical protein
MRPASGADHPANACLTDIPNDAAGHDTLLVDDVSPAVGAALVWFKEGFVALGAMADKDGAAVGADFGAGD